ncbi:MAG: sulfatase-like hydrolase/transferase [Usitatibacteraceae bacterium]
MKSMFAEPRRKPLKQLPFVFVVAAVALALWLVLRIVLWVQIGPAQLLAAQSASAFLRGGWLDLAALAYLAAPIFLVASVLPNGLRAHPIVSKLSWLMLVLMVAALVFGVVAEFVFWDEFTTRFNFIAVDYLIYTNEVIGNIKQSYPVGLIFSAIAIVALLIAWLISRRVKFSADPISWRQRLVLLVAALALPVASYNVANVDQMSGAGNEHALELSGNGLFSLSAAMRRNELDYDKFYKTIPQEEADDILARRGITRAPLSKTNLAAATPNAPATLGPFSRRPQNVVMIMIESMSAEFVGAYGGTKGLTPKMDRLAAEGLKFEQVFATGTRTVRGLEALSLGTPPIPGQAIVRRPGNEHLATLGQLLLPQGYQPYFIYGGYGYFDNMNAYFAGNDYKVVDRTDFPKDSVPFENVWGVADEALFSNAMGVFDKSAAAKKPFFAQIMTTSNHRPFTYPEGRIDIPSPGGRDGGVKYTDFAIGQFIENARSKPWFKDTLFVIVADHCASAAGKTKLPLPNYRIPLIFYAPDMLKPGNYSRMISQIDIAPTLLSILGATGRENFFGESLFDGEPQPARAFVSNYQELGYFADNTLIVLSPKQKVATFSVDPATLAAVPAAENPQLVKEAIAYYQTGSRAFKQGALKSPTHTGVK